MSTEKSDFFSRPAYKLMISDLKLAIPKKSYLTDANDESEREWTLKLAHIPDRLGNPIPLEAFSKPPLILDIKLVWIQGEIKRISKLNPESDNFSLVVVDDFENKNASTAVLHDYVTVPGGDHADVKVGAYIGALGQIWTNTGKEVVIKPAKIMFIGEKPALKYLWKEEVRLTKSFLIDVIAPSFEELKP